jgi:hypothetical protein
MNREAWASSVSSPHGASFCDISRDVLHGGAKLAYFRAERLVTEATPRGHATVPWMEPELLVGRRPW